MIVTNRAAAVTDQTIRAGDLVVIPHDRDPGGIVATVLAFYADSPGWCIDYAYTVGDSHLYGTRYFHAGDFIDVIDISQ